MQIQAVVSENCGMVSRSVGLPVPAQVGYIRISTFNKKTGELFTQQLKELKQAGANAFVLDVRNNGGGYFPAGVQVRPHTHVALRVNTCSIRGVECRLRRAY